MELSEKIMHLIFELQYIVGNECYNPNSYDGHTGETGRSFRYPVWAKSKTYERERKNYLKVTDVNYSDLSSIYYKFGSNHLHVGVALKRILEC